MFFVAYGVCLLFTCDYSLLIVCGCLYVWFVFLVCLRLLLGVYLVIWVWDVYLFGIVFVICLCANIVCVLFCVFTVWLWLLKFGWVGLYWCVVFDIVVWVTILVVVVGSDCWFGCLVVDYCWRLSYCLLLFCLVFVVLYNVVFYCLVFMVDYLLVVSLWFRYCACWFWFVLFYLIVLFVFDFVCCCNLFLVDYLVLWGGMLCYLSYSIVDLLLV